MRAKFGKYLYRNSINNSFANNSHLPNPTDGLVAITFHQEFTGGISIFNLSGKLIFNDVISQSKSYQRQLSANAGTYIIIFKSDTGEPERLKLQVK